MKWEILYKYMAGTCARHELRQLAEWLNENQANEDFFKTFIEHSNHEENRNFKFDAHGAWEQFNKAHKIQAQLELVDITAPAGKRDDFIVAKGGKTDKQGRVYWYLSAAAAVIFMVALFFIAEYSGNHTNNNEITAQEIITSKGQRTNLKLNDGTLITLNSESRLKVPENYGHSSRILYLEGEAFFDVSNDAERAFKVITPQGYVHVLGTQFNVMAYDPGQFEVAVKEGFVSLGTVEGGIPQNESVKLSPNEIGMLRSSGEFAVSDINDIDLFTGWVDGILVFSETPFDEVARQLERWYDIECILEDSQLSERTLTATYDKMPLSEVLEVLSASLRLSYERQKNSVIFRDKDV